MCATPGTWTLPSSTCWSSEDPPTPSPSADRGPGRDGLREWIATLPPGHDHLLATFDTRVTKVRHLPKAASGRAARLITRRGFHLLSRPTGFVVTDIQGDLVEGETERAAAWGRLLALETRQHLVPVPTS